MKKPYPLHFQVLRKCFNRNAVLYVLLIAIGLFGSLTATSQTAIHPVVNDKPKRESEINRATREETTEPIVNREKPESSVITETQTGERKGHAFTVHVFDHKVFIENQGQYDGEFDSKEKILFHAKWKAGQIKAYFTPNGIKYRHTYFVVDSTKVDNDGDKEEKGDKEAPHIAIHQDVSVTWVGASSNVAIVAGDRQNYPMTFSLQEGYNKYRSISVGVFKKVTYKNMYPGIDIEYILPEGANAKNDLKYTIIVHPGADLSQVKLKYTGAKGIHLDNAGNAVVENNISSCTDYAPISSYQEGGTANVKYVINGTEESFEVEGGYDNTKTLVIDPTSTWTKGLTGFGASTYDGNTYGGAYKVDFDYNGNVFVFGDWYPVEVSMYNSAGTLKWTHAAFTYDNGNGGYYQSYDGDFAVDKNTGEAYIGQGYDAGGAWSEKISPLNGSMLSNVNAGAKFSEMWRFAFSACTSQIVIGGGGTNSPSSQVAMMDTNMAAIVPQNPLGVGDGGHDVYSMALDPTGDSVYMAVPQVEISHDGSFNNYTFVVPVPALKPYKWATPNNYAFEEFNSVTFMGPGANPLNAGPGNTANSMSGMAVSQKYIYMYDGGYVAQYNKFNGNQIGGFLVINGGGNEYNQAGIATDGCGNVFVGDNNKIDTYNSSLGGGASTTVPGTGGGNTVYDIEMGVNQQYLYVCGNGFVAVMANPIFSTAIANPTIAVTNTTCGLSNGSATANLTVCGAAPVGTITYKWLPGGQSTQTISGLAAGTYTVSISIGCGTKYTATATIGTSTAPSLIAAATPATICPGSSTTLSASGGSGASTYNWSTGQNGTSSISVSPLSNTTYTVTDATCGTYSTTITVNVNSPPPAPTLGSNSPICSGQNLTLTSSAAGATGYTWAGPNGFTANTANTGVTSATTAAAGIYTVTATNGTCTSTNTINVTINATPATPSVGSNSPICAGATLTLTTTSGGPTYNWSGPNLFASGSKNPNIPSATTAASGIYTLTVTSGSCTSLPGTVTVTVNAVPAQPTANSNSPVCAGQNISLTSSGTGGIISWTGPNGFTANTANTTVTSATAAASGTYNVTYASVAGCPSVAGSVAVTVNPLPANPVASATATSVCAGGTINLTTTSTGPTWSWTGPNGFTSNIQDPSIPNATIAAGGTYTLTVYSAAGCASAIPGTVTITVNAVPATPTLGGLSPICSGQTLNLTASAGATGYNWTGPNSFTANTQNTNITNITTAASGTYTLVATGAGGCSSLPAYINITVNPTPAAPTASSNSPICAGTTLTLMGSNGSSTYNWTGPNGFTSNIQGPSITSATVAAAGTYSLTTTSALGCTSGNGTVVVTVNPLPAAPTAGSNSPICSGANLSLTASNVAGATGYNWTGPNSFTSNVQNTGVTSATTAATGTYIVNAVEGTCAGPTASVTVVVNPTPTLSIAPVAVTICPGATASLTASNTAGAGAYTWTPNTAITPSTGATVTVNPTVTTTYTVNETSSLGCPALPKTIVITVANSLTVTVTPASPAICSGDSVQLQASGASSFTWKPSTGLNCTTCPSPWSKPAGPVTYTVVGASGSCKDSANATVTINPTPTVNIVISGIAASICPGDSMGMTASGAGAGGTYTWTPVTGLSCTSCPNPNAGPGSTTTYTVTGTNTFGCKSTATQVITVYPKPVITMTTSKPIICAGDTTTLRASGVTTYNWAPDSELNVQTGPVVIAGPTVTVTYTVTGKGTGGCKTKDSVTVTVNPKPSVTIVPPNPSVCAGTGVPLTASGANTYAWSPTTGLVPTNGSAITATPGGTTTYTVIGTSLLGCRDTVNETITVNPNPTVTVSPATPAICFGDSANLIVSGVGAGATYAWSPSTGLNNTNTDSVWTSLGATGTYTVTGTTAAGCKGTANVTVTVGTLTVTAVAAKTTLCSGSSTKITASGAGSFTWKPNTGLSGTTGSVVIATPSATTTYTVIGTSSGGLACSDSAFITITVNTTPTITVTPASKLLCFGAPGDTIHATGAGTGGTYAWKPNIGVTNVAGDSTVIVDPSATATYTITGTTALGCPATATFTMTVDKVTVTATTVPSPASICAGSSLTITAKGATTFIWSPKNGLNDTNTSVVIDTATTSFTYKVVGTDALGCKDSVNVPVTVNPLPIVKITTADSVLCNGGSTILNATGASTYTWLPAIGLTPASGSSVSASPSGTVVYTVTGTSAAGCSNTASISVTINSTPTVSINLSGGNTLCAGQPYTMTGTGATNYLWSPATGLNTNTGATVRDSITTGPITYKVIGSNGTCKDSATATLNIFPALVVTPVPDSMCSGKNSQAQVQVNVTGGDPSYVYSWSNGITGNGPGPYVVIPNGTTVYTCTVTDACGSSSTANDTVKVNVGPTAGFIPTPDTIMGGQFVSFVDTSKNATSWQWTFGDGGISDSAFPYYQYVQQGQYVVVLIVSNITGCTDTATHIVYVTEGIFVPNVFTPNGDGVNDEFHVTAGSLKTYHIEIFNRWGERVFMADSPETNWDGRSESGVQESDGDYYYLIKATDYSNKPFNLHGYIQLIRN